MQRHHLLPRELSLRSCFAPMFAWVGRERIGFEDFRINGMLLPASEEEAARTGLPLHRGPHGHYNAMVAERLGQIESGWAARNLRSSDAAQTEALMRMRLLQAALRRRLIQRGMRPILLNRHDPLGHGVDFSALDAMADLLWGETAIPGL